MKKFMQDDFLLQTPSAQKLYAAVSDTPIIDYHCHLDAKEIYENVKFENLTEAWLKADHYKWRAMRNMGVNEELITGNASDYDKFVAWATVMPYLAGNPLYHFSHLELKKYLGIDTPLSPETAEEIWNKAQKVLSDTGARQIMEKAHVEAVITTNDPTETAEYHVKLKKEKFYIKVLPAFRPDKALNIEKPGFNAYVKALAASAGTEITDLDSLKYALKTRLDYFVSSGAVASDHGLDYVPAYSSEALSAETVFGCVLSGKPVTKADTDNFKFEMLRFLGTEYYKRGMVMEIHFGCVRNPNSVTFAQIGADSGFDCIRRDTDADNLFALLDALRSANALPKTLLFSLNPADNDFLVSLSGAFNDDADGIKGKVQQGSAWWFNDHFDGMNKQISTYAAGMPIDSFIGMLTDSRSLLSYARHDYFRRILANYLGNLVESGMYPENCFGYLEQIARDVAYENVKAYFNL